MRHIISILTFCLLTNSILGQTTNQLKYDFDETKYKFDSPDSLVDAFIKTLTNYDSNKIKNLMLSTEVLQYFYEQISIHRPNATNMENTIKRANKDVDIGQKELIIATINLKKQIEKDNIDLLKSKIQIKYELGDWYGLKPNVMFTSIDIIIKNKGNKYIIKLPVIEKIKNKWFIGGSEINWQGQKIPVDKISD
jgi:hypothetical protein